MMDATHAREWLLLKRKILNLRLSALLNPEKSERLLAEAEQLERKLPPDFLLPREDELDRALNELSALPKDEVARLFAERSGPIERLSQLMRFYLARAREIAWLQSNIPPALRATVRSGRLEEMPAPDRGEEIAIHLNRVHLFCVVENGKLKPSEENPYEDEVVFGEEVFWTEKGKGQELLQVLSELERVSREVQLRNAERQIRAFTQDEEAQFRDLQAKYLSLLRKRDALIR